MYNKTEMQKVIDELCKLMRKYYKWRDYKGEKQTVNCVNDLIVKDCGGKLNGALQNKV